MFRSSLAFISPLGAPDPPSPARRRTAHVLLWSDLAGATLLRAGGRTSSNPTAIVAREILVIKDAAVVIVALSLVIAADGQPRDWPLPREARDLEG